MTKGERREAKVRKRRRMRVNGKSVFAIQRELGKRAEAAKETSR